MRLARAAHGTLPDPIDRRRPDAPERALGAALIEGQEPIPWLNRFFNSIMKAQRGDLFEKFALLPDQSSAGTLKNRAKLGTDTGIDEGLKDIASTQNVVAREELLDRRVELANIPELPKKNESDLQGLPIQAISAGAETHAGSQQYRDASVSLFSWLLRRKRFDPQA